MSKTDLFTIDLETDRLHIRKTKPEDIEDALEHRLDNEVSRYTSDPMTREEAITFYDKRMLPWSGQENEWLSLTIILKETGKAIGELGFNYWSVKNQIGEFGYRLNSKYQGRGFAKEATEALIDELFNKHNVHKLMAVCDPRNTLSYRLMEKLGMVKEAHFEKQNYRRGEWVDEYVYSLLNPNEQP